MQEFYVVDGPNVIHYGPEFGKMLASGLDHSRDKLVAIFANFACYNGASMMDVFDAHLLKRGSEHWETVSGIEVYYKPNPTEGYLEDKLPMAIRGILERMRAEKTKVRQGWIYFALTSLFKISYN